MLDPGALSEALGVPVIPTVAVRRKGISDLVWAINNAEGRAISQEAHPRPHVTLPERRLVARNIARGLVRVANRRLSGQWPESGHVSEIRTQPGHAAPAGRCRSFTGSSSAWCRGDLQSTA